MRAVADTRVAVGATTTLAAMVAACSGGGGGPSTPATDATSAIDAAVAGAHAARFVGLWAVEQPNHALYEVTYYRLADTGAVTIGPSDPPDCGTHLERHCVTGSVARCTPAPPQDSCLGTPTCVFGDRWSSQGDRTLVIAGVCSDQVARDVVIQLPADASHAAQWGGAGATVLTVGGEPGWAHDNWSWAFRKCPPGTSAQTCIPASP